MSQYESPTFSHPLSLRIDSKTLSIMSTSPSGRDVVLAGRSGLLIIDLDDPFTPPRSLHHSTSWEVADVQWSPHKSKPSWVISTSNQKAMLWNINRPSNDAIERVLHAHTRAITDIHFHPCHPEILATCSVDSNVLSWDMRCEKPVMQWSDWRAGASQVKWNHKDENILASSHDSVIHIWDIRKGAIPKTTVEAHKAKINGLDWSRENKNELISCSNDMSVKFWNFNEPNSETNGNNNNNSSSSNSNKNDPYLTIKTDFPVSKTRHLPFGDHVCGIMPLRGGNDSLFIVNYDGKSGIETMDPVYAFKGHTEPLRDFVWRERHSTNTSIDDREFQLVTWSKDCDLRLWPIKDEMYPIFNHTRNLPLKNNKKLIDFSYTSYRPEPIQSTENELIIRKKGGRRKLTHNFNHLDWISGIRIGGASEDPNGGPLNLGEEVSNVGHKFPKLRFERISVSTGILVISLNGPWGMEDNDDLIFIRVEIDFPTNYPNSGPTFKIEDTHELSSLKHQEILNGLNDISNKYSQSKRFCLESCLRFLLGEEVEFEFASEETNDITFNTYLNKDEPISGVSDDESISDDDQIIEPLDGMTSSAHTVQNLKKPILDSVPIPKGCGAIWTPSGHLVCFFIPDVKKDIKFGTGGGFSLAKTLKRKKFEQGIALDSSDDEESDDSLSDDLEGYMKAPTLKSSEPSVVQLRNVVKIYDFQYLIPAKMELAYEYRVLGDLPHILATHNAEVAERFGYRTIADCWRILAVTLVKDVQFELNDVIERNLKLFQRNNNNEKLVRNQFFWGEHPFGATWLIQQMMNYFKKIGDVQMLAMISCIIFENGKHKNKPEIPINTPYNQRNFKSMISRQDSKLSSNSRYSQNIQLPTQGLSMTNYPYRSSVSFNSPRLASMSSLSSRESLNSVSTYEPHSRGIKTAISTMALQPLVATTTLTAAPKATTPLPLPLPSPSLAALAPAPSMPQLPVSATVSGPILPIGNLPVGINSMSDHSSTILPQMVRSMSTASSNVFSKNFRSNKAMIAANAAMVNHKVHIEMMDVHQNDEFDYLFPLTQFLDKQELHAYRAEYASILFCWGLPLSRLKILKFNYTSKSDEFKEHVGEIGGDGGICQLCNLHVKKRVVVCARCGHIMHAQCGMEWWQTEIECPSGCGCECLKWRVG